jgi:TatD DNase family protein
MDIDSCIFIDSHAHVEMEPLYSKRTQIIHRANENHVCAIITVGIDLEDARRAVELTEEFEFVYASIGYHPHNVESLTEDDLIIMRQLADHPKVVGYGEIGLDFFRNWSPRDDQIRLFSLQLSLAKQLNKPVVIHLRDAYDKGLEMLEQEAPFDGGGVIHCFSGTLDDADRALQLGFHISIPGTVTYKKNELLRGIIKKLPPERILLETDCPFLSPEPLRGKDNEPANIIHTASKVAEIYGLPLRQIAETTSINTAQLFRLPLEKIKNSCLEK